MSSSHNSLTRRRSGLPLPTLIGVVGIVLLLALYPDPHRRRAHLEADFAIRPDELTLRYVPPATAPRLAFDRYAGTPASWQALARERLAELLGLGSSTPGFVDVLREVVVDGVAVRALAMQVSPELTLPAYLLGPVSGQPRRGTVVALHGHGTVEPLVGFGDDYHHQAAMLLASEGWLVLCPELRGFGALRDPTAHEPTRGLRYWTEPYSHFTLATDALQRGRTLIGQTVDDLLRWEAWLAGECDIDALDVVGIAYGGDLALCYAAFSERVSRVFASGTLSSFEEVFATGGNPPAHCIPRVLRWLERSDIAGLCAPRPLAIHFGALDRPGGRSPGSYNASVEPTFDAVRRIYAAFDAADAVELRVSPTLGHEMDVGLLLEWLEAGSEARLASAREREHEHL